MKICSRAPTRISFAGGGTDIPEIANRTGGCVTSAAITRYVYASLKTRHDKELHVRSVGMSGSETLAVMNDVNKLRYDGKVDLVKSVVEELVQGEGFDISIVSEVPEHSGLGASASAYVALIAAFNDYYNLCMGKKEMAELAFELETKKLGNKVGKQDQYAASYGGLNFMEFSKNMDVNIMPVKVSQATIAGLERDIALFYVAERPKTAGDVIKKQLKNGANKELFEKTKELGHRARDALEKNDLESFGNIMALVWEYKKRFSRETTNPMIENMHKAAVENGAYGGKISGAGSGGCGFWFCRHGMKSRVVTALERLGAKRLDFSFDFEGVKAWRT